MTKSSKIELHIVRLQTALAARVDAWAAAHAVDKAAAIPRLVEIGLQPGAANVKANCDDFAVEAEAAHQIGLLIDPETPEEERERRIHRLIDGPPEFVDFRIDLPGRRPN